ncbi:hypothetical protein FOMPIDRAFT_83713 [Fomitopsis schrenkii]|uniref:Uncharacterized protein n=1 Tax=Fomitopsis schrenkii TaxID=2126942 RepID=S8FYS1_FOMSC|nr:hypothetical protein FOMPIDRAFT_83713 [Fomitopsis schrenkii]
MAYAFYQGAQNENWGTPEYKFGEPPVPGWEPQGHWGGQDYFAAHAFAGDQAFYQSVMSRMSAEAGIGFNEARYWHRRIYGGLVNLAQVLPADIGAAAAYEAYRIFKYRRERVFDPLGQDVERQREALIAMAVAEATQLWQYTGRALDSYGKQDAAEAAAATASRIARRVVVQEDMETNTMGMGMGMPGAAGMGGGMAPGMAGGMGGMGGGMGGMGGGMGGMGGGMNSMGGGMGGMGGGMGGMGYGGTGYGGMGAGGTGMPGMGMNAGTPGMNALGTPGNPVARDFANGMGGRPRRLRRVSSANSMVGGGGGMGMGVGGGQGGGVGPMTSPAGTPMPPSSRLVGTPAPPPGEGPALGPGGMPAGAAAWMGGAAGMAGMAPGAAGLGGAGSFAGAPPIVSAPQAYPAMGGAIYAQQAAGYPGTAGGAYAAQHAMAGGMPGVSAPGAYAYGSGGYGGYAQPRGTVIPAPPGGTVVIDWDRKPRRHRHRSRSVDMR